MKKESRENWTTVHRTKEKHGLLAGRATMGGKAFYITAGELADRGFESMPDEMVSGKGLIFSSPATLSYNSPGAQGFGVKRAGLVIPESVMLLVAPACCGRNTTILGDMGGYSHRTFFLEMDENDLVTGRHLTDIPQVIREILKVCRSRGQDPKAVVICITCVDALMGTDLERVCRKAEEETGVKVVPTYMYALTREGRNPPMVAVRESIYNLLERLPVKTRMTNILGFFSSIDKNSELFQVLGRLGINQVKQVARCSTMDEFLEMGAANFNILLHPEARKAAVSLQERLGMPFIEMSRVYEVDRIGKQYRGLAGILGGSVELDQWESRAAEEAEKFKADFSGRRLAIGQVVDGSPAEMALAFTRLGLKVTAVFANQGEEDFPYIRELAQLDPEVKFYATLSPSMINYREAGDVDLTLGMDGAYYYPEVPNVPWNQEDQPFGYSGFIELLKSVREAFEQDNRLALPEKISFPDPKIQGCPAEKETGVKEEYNPYADPENRGPKGMRLFMSPFTPDQSGACSVLYEYGGMLEILDAGGCVGNICGYDEPRWMTKTSAIFSAGLRDMDAILGRDQLLIEKTGKALEDVSPAFVGLIGTPVPSVIATDYRALKKLMEKDYGLPVVTVETNGLELYDKGQEKAYMQLFKQFAEDVPEEASVKWNSGRYLAGVLGATPLDTLGSDSHLEIEKMLKKTGILPDEAEVVVFGRGDRFENLKDAGKLNEIIVVSPSGMKPALYMNDRFGIPFRTMYPLGGEDVSGLARKIIRNNEGRMPSKILIIHQQVFAHSLRNGLRKAFENDEKFSGGSLPEIQCATWFMTGKELMEQGDGSLRQERDLTEMVFGGNYDMVLGDPVYRRALPGYKGIYLSLPHYVASGELAGIRTEEDFWQKAGELV